MNTSDVNLLYHGVVVGSITMLYTMILKKTLKVRPADLDKFNVEDSVKLGGTLGLSMMTQTWLVKQGILPGKIINGAIV